MRWKHEEDVACGTTNENKGGKAERTEHAFALHVCPGAVPAGFALQYKGRACFVVSVQPAAVAYVLVTFQMPGTRGNAGATVAELRSPFWRK